MKLKTFFLTALAALAISFGSTVATPLAQAGNSNLTQTPLLSQLAQTVTAPQQFDGRQTYQAAFEAFRDNHIMLADSAVRAKWVAEWEHKFDKTGDLNTPEGTDKAIRQMKESLGQRFDYFFDAKRTQAEKDQVSSSLVGIGATMKLRDMQGIVKSLPKGSTMDDLEKALKVGPGHELVVQEPIPGGPAAKFLKPEDVVVEVDGKPIDGMLMSDAIAKIKGNAGTTVSITVLRTDDKGTAQKLTFSITRAVVQVPVVHTKDLGNGISYIKLDNFMSRNATAEMAKALQAAAKGKGIILDLRGNPGGELGSVIAMASFMIPEGTILVTHTRNGDDVTEQQIIVHRDFALSIGPDENDPTKTGISLGKRPPLLVPEDMPIVVLVDEGSASASEILSGALQANHRAMIVGKPTVGKGVGQVVIDLPFGRRLHVTNFEFLPGGKKMDWIGIIPEVQVDYTPSADGKTDSQLDEALKRITQQVTDKASHDKEADDLQKKNHADFDQQLQLQKKQDQQH